MNKKLNFIILISVIMLSLSSLTSFSHSGRTDANGGHYDRSTGEYHYHTGEYAGRTQYGNSKNDDNDLKTIKEKEYSSTNSNRSSNSGYPSSGTKKYVSSSYTDTDTEEDIDNSPSSSWTETILVTLILLSFLIISIIFKFNIWIVIFWISCIILYFFYNPNAFAITIGTIIAMVYMSVFLEVFSDIFHSIVEHFSHESEYCAKINSTIELNNNIQKCISNINSYKEKIFNIDRKLNKKIDIPDYAILENGKLIPKSKDFIFYCNPAGKVFHSKYGCTGAIHGYSLFKDTCILQRRKYCKLCSGIDEQRFIKEFMVYTDKLTRKNYQDRFLLQEKNEILEDIKISETELSQYRKELNNTINFLTENRDKIYKKKSLVKELENAENVVGFKLPRNRILKL